MRTEVKIGCYERIVIVGSEAEIKKELDLLTPTKWRDNVLEHITGKDPKWWGVFNTGLSVIVARRDAPDWQGVLAEELGHAIAHELGLDFTPEKGERAAKHIGGMLRSVFGLWIGVNEADATVHLVSRLPKHATTQSMRNRRLEALHNDGRRARSV